MYGRVNIGGGGGGVASSPQYVDPATRYTWSLMHFEDDVTKDEIRGNKWQVVGNPQLSAQYSKFGKKSLYLDGSSYLYLPCFQTCWGQSYTLEAWAMVDVDASFWASSVIGMEGSGYLGIRPGGTVIICSNPTEIVATLNPADDVPHDLSGKFHHIALVLKAEGRETPVWYYFIDGILAATLEYKIETVSREVVMGVCYNGYGKAKCYIDEFRFSHGIARYTEDFTPPTEPFEVD